MEITVSIVCDGCGTDRTEILKEGVNHVRGCSCGYFGVEDETITITTEKNKAIIAGK